MAHRHRGGRQSLSSALDKEVYQIVRKILDEREKYADANTGRLPALLSRDVYDEIRNSNSSLNRRPKQALEASVERVLESLRGEDVDDNDNEDEEVLDTPQAREEPVRQSNRINKSITGVWPMNNGPIQKTGVATPKRERQANGESLPKRRKTEKPAIDKSPPTHVSFADMGGIDDIAEELVELLALPMLQPEFFTSQKLQPTRGILLHGPPGCGKTMFANALAAEMQVNFISIAAPSIVSGMSGESEKALREHFEEAKKSAPCLMFIDEIDAITPKRDSAQREMEKRIVAQFLTCMDDLDLVKTDGKPVVVLAATNRPDSLDPALRRGGRFDKEVMMPVPNEHVREQILRSLTREWNLGDDVDFAMLARRTPGCVGADLRDLVSTTVNVAIKRYLRNLEEAGFPVTNQGEHQSEMEVDGMHPDTTEVSISMSPKLARLQKLIKHLHANKSTLSPTTSLIRSSDFLTALPQIQPSALREGFATIPSTTFNDIGALSTHISTLNTALIQPIIRPNLYQKLGIRLSSGVLLWGPPGNGKTLLAKAVANSSHANFISVKGPELLNKYVGESERAVRTLFARARSSVPVIIFFDELDALVPRRDGSMSEASSRVVNTLLTELDGVGTNREGIYIVAATNRPDIIDPAMLRPGRLETLLYVGLPSEDDRVEILKTLTKKLENFEWRSELEEIARGCTRFSGADLESLVRQAGYAAITRCTDPKKVAVSNEDDVRITTEDFRTARNNVQPSVSVEENARFMVLQRELGKVGA